MTSGKIKIAGVLFLLLAFVVTMSACDMTSDETVEVSENGELIVTADMSEMELRTLETQTDGEVDTMSTVDQRFENYKVVLYIDSDEEESVDADYDEDEKTFVEEGTDDEIGFEVELAPGAYDVEVYLRGEYTENESEVDISFGYKDDIVVYEGETTIETVDVDLNDGALHLTADVPDDADNGKLDLVELREFDGDDPYDVEYQKEDWNGELVEWGNYEDVPAERQEDDLAPRQYEIYVEWTDSSTTEGDHEQRLSIHVLPGVEKAVNITFLDGEMQIDIDYELPLEAPEDVWIDEDSPNKLRWDEVDEAVKYHIVRKNVSDFTDEDDRYWEVVATAEDIPYEIDIEDRGEDEHYEFTVVAVDEEGLTSDYSEETAGYPIDITSTTANTAEELIYAASATYIETIELGNDIDVSEAVGSNQFEILSSVEIDGNGHSIEFDQEEYDSQFGRPAIRAMEGDIELRNLEVVLIPGAANEERDDDTTFAQGVKVEDADADPDTADSSDGVDSMVLEDVDITLDDQHEVGNANTAGLGIHIDPEDIEAVDVDIDGFKNPYYPDELEFTETVDNEGDFMDALDDEEVNTIRLEADMDVHEEVGSNQLEILRSVEIDGNGYSIEFDQEEYDSQFGRPAIRAMEGDIELRNLEVVLIPGAANEERDDDTTFAQGVKVEDADADPDTADSSDGVDSMVLEDVDITLDDQHEVGNANTAGLGIHIDEEAVEWTNLFIEGFETSWYVID